MVFIPEIQQLDKDTYYFECCAGLGDTMLTCGYKYALEEKYQAPIRFLVKPSHLFIPEMYHIKDSLVIGQDVTEDFVKKNTESKPKKGKVYAASPCKHPELWEYFKPMYYLTLTVRYIPWFQKFLGIPAETKLKYPLSYPELSKEIKEACIKIAPLSEIVLLSPEATSIAPIPFYFWKDLAERLNSQGLSMISNVVNPANTIPGSIFIKMDVSDAVALAMQCRSVYSIRSGFCDPIFKKGSNLHVFHSSHNSFFIFEMNEMFPGLQIDEQIILS